VTDYTVLNWTAAKIWEYVLSQLQADMSKASFDTWVKSTEALSLEGPTLTIGCHNAYGRDWLESRLTTTIQRMVSGMINQPATVRFQVIDLSPENLDASSDSADEEIEPASDRVDLEPIYSSLRDALIEPDRVVKMPVYFLRWLPYVGAKTIFEVLGFWQEYYLASKGKNPSGGEKVSTRIERVCSWSGVSRAQLFRDLADNQSLGWFLKKIETDYEQDRNTGRSKKSANKYQLFGTPLTPGDADDLRQFLMENGILDDPNQALRVAVESQPNQILAYPYRLPSKDFIGQGTKPITVQGVVRDLIGRRMDQISVELVDHLADRLLGSSEFILIRWYFLNHWLPLLGHNPAMLVILLRNLCYFNDQTGEIRDEVWIENGYSELAARLGIENPRQLVQWFPAMFERGGQLDAHTERTDRENERRAQLREHLSQFLKRTDCRTSGQASYGWQFHVLRMDPLVPDHHIIKDAAGRLLSRAEDDGVLEQLYSFLNWLPNDCFETLKNEPMIVLRLSKIANDCLETLEAIFNDCIETLKPLSNGCFETLLKTLKAFKDSQIIKDTSSNQDSPVYKKLQTDNGSGGWDIEANWNLESLLVSVNDQVRETLLRQEKLAWPYLSWILYGIATPTIQNPVSLAISKLKSNPGKGAGGAFDRIARMQSAQFVRNLREELTFWPPREADWRAVFQAADSSRKRLLADILGLSEAVESNNEA
jgi:hypothetical protein